MPARFAILPRYGNENDIKWFEAKSTYVLHWGNAYEDGDEIVLDGYFQEDPDPEPLPGLPPMAVNLWPISMSTPLSPSYIAGASI